ncbi:hypothetical protein J2Z69_001952 [Paenibacillus shirakamiensis]|uniref:Uncharacterized protein n=1 Tax=Paenibacillus shirakamiensis TaxID=1265935 RepID=A0ABS4JJX8_9BACL|nr:hypothetical protein [Paenibacillus shirakamiensis]
MNLWQQAEYTVVYIKLNFREDGLISANHYKIENYEFANRTNSVSSKGNGVGCKHLV